jgi:hypothetical protein
MDHQTFMPPSTTMSTPVKILALVVHLVQARGAQCPGLRGTARLHLRARGGPR